MSKTSKATQDDFLETRKRLRSLGISDLGIAGFELLTHEQQLGLKYLVEQYEVSPDGKARYVQ